MFQGRYFKSILVSKTMEVDRFPIKLWYSTCFHSWIYRAWDFEAVTWGGWLFTCHVDTYEKSCVELVYSCLGSLLKRACYIGSTES